MPKQHLLAFQKRFPSKTDLYLYPRTWLITLRLIRLSSRFIVHLNCGNYAVKIPDAPKICAVHTQTDFHQLKCPISLQSSSIFLIVTSWSYIITIFTSSPKIYLEVEISPLMRIFMAIRIFLALHRHLPLLWKMSFDLRLLSSQKVLIVHVLDFGNL